MGRSYQLWHHATDTFAILVVCAQNAIWDERTLPSGFICGSSTQQFPFPRPVSSENIFSFQLSGLCLVTLIKLAPPIVALHHGKTAGLGERCLNTFVLLTLSRNMSCTALNSWSILNSKFRNSCFLERHTIYINTLYCNWQLSFNLGFFYGYTYSSNGIQIPNSFNYLQF